MTERGDSFRSPSDPNRRFDVLPDDLKIGDAKRTGVDQATIITSDGALTVPIEMVQSDSLRKKPRLGSVPVRQVVESANARWALGDLDEAEVNGA